MSIDWLKRRNARSKAARTSSGSSTRTQASRSFVSATDWKNLIAAAWRVCNRGSSSTFGVSAPWTSVVEKIASASCSFAGHAPVVDDEAVGLLVPEGAVHAGDGLQQPMLLQRLIEIHDLLDRRVETGQQHVAHDQDRERIAPVLEPVDHPLLFVPGQMPLREPLLVIVARRHDDGRLRARSAGPASPCS